MYDLNSATLLSIRQQVAEFCFVLVIINSDNNGDNDCDNDFESILKKLSFRGIMTLIITILIGRITMVTEVVAALVWRDDKFMICQRPVHKARGLLWEFVGGKVEPGETKEQALIRECREELAVTILVGEKFMEVTHEYPDLTVHLILFNATISEGEPQKLEHNDIKWITPSEIPNYEFCPADVEILEKISNKI